MSPSALPDGEPVPPDGALPDEALAELAGQPLSVYLHVPFCATRCGYCDFNTYTAGELGDATLTDAYVAGVGRELALARRVLAGRHTGVATVFVGGGTPTLLPPATLGALLHRIDDELGLLPGAEVTTEANPETVDEGSLAALRAAGYNRVSLGMQSQVPHVLRTLERRHTPDRALAAAGWARAAGFERVNLDLIYGTPGESLDDWRRSLDAVVATGVRHVSAYALIVEEGTRLAAQVRRGQVPMTDDDDLADKYLLAEETLTAAGLAAYEVSNWAAPGHACAHNEAYWRGGAWWGIGAGAHSHVGGVRWWNVKHPRRYADLTLAGSPGHAREVVAAADRRVERVLLELRLADGLPLEVLTPSEQERVGDVVARGLGAVEGGRLRLTLRGRLLADAVIRDLLD